MLIICNDALEEIVCQNRSFTKIKPTILLHYAHAQLLASTYEKSRLQWECIIMGACIETINNRAGNERHGPFAILEVLECMLSCRLQLYFVSHLWEIQVHQWIQSATIWLIIIMQGSQICFIQIKTYLDFSQKGIKYTQLKMHHTEHFLYKKWSMPLLLYYPCWHQ